MPEYSHESACDFRKNFELRETVRLILCGPNGLNLTSIDNLEVLLKLF